MATFICRFTTGYKKCARSISANLFRPKAARAVATGSIEQFKGFGLAKKYLRGSGLEFMDQGLPTITTLL